MRRATAAIVLVTLSLVLAAAARAGGGPAAATVNGVAVPKDRVEAGVNEYLNRRGTGFQFMTNPEQYKEVRRKVLDVLIDRELLWQEAREKELVASTQEVDREIARIRESFPSPENFETRLMIGGFTETTYADHVRRELSVQRLIREEIAPGVAVAEEEIDTFYRDNPEKAGRPEEVRAYLHAEKVRQAVEEHVERLRAAGEIKVMEPR
jgi:parvulin-like peptidyl-prolyl isomerase